MLISQNDNLLPRIYNARRDISQAPKRTDKYRNGQTIVLKRNHPFLRSYLDTSLADADTNIYNTANKVEPLRINPVGMFVDIYAWVFSHLKVLIFSLHILIRLLIKASSWWVNSIFQAILHYPYLHDKWSFDMRHFTAFPFPMIEL